MERLSAWERERIAEVAAGDGDQLGGRSGGQGGSAWEWSWSRAISPIRCPFAMGENEG